MVFVQVRPKLRNDPSNTVAYTPKPRNSRIRSRPSTTTTTESVTAASPDGADQSYQQISRFNKDFYQDAPSRHRNFQRPSSKPARTNEQVNQEWVEKLHTNVDCNYVFISSRNASNTTRSRWTLKNLSGLRKSAITRFIRSMRTQRKH